MRRPFFKFVVASILLGFVGTANAKAAGPADYCDPQWQIGDKMPPPILTRALIFDGQRFMAFGELGTILTSNDGETWSWHPRLDAGSAAPKYALYGNGRYFIGPSLALSLDGQRWEGTTLPAFYTSIAFAGNFFFALGSSTYIYVSKDTLHWWGVPSLPAGVTLTCVAYDSLTERYVAGSTTGDVAISPDGMNWTWYPTPELGSISALINGGGRWLAIKNVQSGKVLLGSGDGENWQVLQTPEIGQGPIAYGAGRFVAFTGFGGYGSSNGMVSLDGVSWIAIPSWTSQPVLALAYGAGRFVAATYMGEIWASSDGFSWHPTGTGNCLPSFSRVFRLGAPPAFYAVGWNGQYEIGIWRSEDGIAWTVVWKGPHNLVAIAYGGGLFVAVNGQGLILSSADGVTWEIVRPRDNQSPMIDAVCYGGGHFVAVGSAGYGLWSPDGKNWTLFPTPDPRGNLTTHALAYGAGRFVLGAVGHSLYSSPDGLSWEKVWDGGSSTFKAVVYGDQGFIAGPSQDLDHPGCLISPDGVHWQTSDPFLFNFNVAWYLNKRYMVLSETAEIFVSSNGVQWSHEPSSFPFYPVDLMWDGEKLVGFGRTDEGCVLRFSGENCMPSVTGLSPANGPTDGGTNVAISGHSLSDVSAVYFGDVPAASFNVVSDELIMAVTPSHDRIAAWVNVESPAGRSVAVSGASYTFESPTPYFDIARIDWLASKPSLVISGFGFHRDCIVRINGVRVPKLKMKPVAGGVLQAIVTGGAALRALLPKGTVVAVTLDNPGNPLMTAIGLFKRTK